MMKNQQNDLPEVDTEIDGILFTMNMFNAEKGIDILVKLLKLMGPSLARMLQNGLGAQVTGEMLSHALIELFARLTEKEVKEVVAELLEQCSADGRSFNRGGWKMFFGGKLGLMSRVLIWAAKEQFEDFLSGVGGLQQVARADTRSKSPTT